MCWIGDTSKFEIAKKDIPIYKVMEIVKDGNFLSYFRGAKYKKGTLVTSEIYKTGCSIITKALHSYSIKNTKPEICNNTIFGEIVSLITILSTNGMMVEDYGSTKSKLVLGYIPKGSVYCENGFGEIVSNQLVMTRICSEKELKKLLK